MANKFNLAGKSELDRARVDMVVEQLIDFQNAFIKAHFEQDETKKKELNEKLANEVVPQNLQFLEKILQSNKSGSDWYVGDSITLADIVAFNIWGWVRDKIAPALEKFPLVKANDEKVGNLSQITEWIAKRPETEL